MKDPRLIDFSDKHVTYLFQEGISSILSKMPVVLIFALISMIISFIIGMRKKDCIVVFVTNIMTKTIILGLELIFLTKVDFEKALIIGLFLGLVSIFIEGYIYNRTLKYKKNKGIVISILCNLITVVVILVFFVLFINRDMIIGFKIDL